MTSDDNIDDEDRERFELAFFDTQQAIVHRFMDDGLPNAYLDTVIARMIANRSAVADESIAATLQRLLRMAEAHERKFQEQHDFIRQSVREIRAGHKETKH